MGKKYIFLVLSVLLTTFSLFATPMGRYVGELQEKWEFPSDHLPIGMRIDDLTFSSWNVLDTAYIDWVVEKNSQGLSRSLIAKENIYLQESKCTLRDVHVIDKILLMISQSKYPKDFIALQEVGEGFLLELKKRMPTHFAIVENEGNASLINTSVFTVVKARSVTNVFSSDTKRTVQDLLLLCKKTNRLYRIVNVHIPGDPNKPARYEFTAYLAKTFDPKIVTCAMGDMNFNEEEMADALTKAFYPNASPFVLLSPYCTNISPYKFFSKDIDHFIIYSFKKPLLLKSDEVLEGLSSIEELLR